MKSTSDPVAHDPVVHFAESRWTMGVLGLGYVGLPLLLTASRAGLGAVGFDISEGRVSALASGQSHVDDVSNDDLAKALADGVTFSSDPSDLGHADALFICVPSPLGRNRQPDLSHVTAAVTSIEDVLRPGQLLVLESTSYPGTTDDYLLPAVHRAGLVVDEDVFVAFSPERVSPGDSMKTADIPKVVGGVTELSGAVAAAAYRRLVPAVHVVSSAQAAEMSKLLENTYRAVNIGLINEMTMLAHELEIDIWEVIDAAATKPFGFQPFYPGPGVGGHCIPLDPQFLAWRAREAKFTTRFIDTADQVNTQMPSYTVSRIADLLNREGLPIQGAEILAVGIAYKPNIADDRESASLEVLRELADGGANITVIDPLVGQDRIRGHGYLATDDSEDFGPYDIAIILTDHDEIDYVGIARDVPVVFDSRGIYRRLGIHLPNIESL
jgi:UDP-N-acetyl-D-glucosamine dehydrogenase